MTESKKRIAVIGAGPAGAIATDALVKEGTFDTIRVFERQEIVGGTWVWNPEIERRLPSLEAVIAEQADRTAEIPNSFPADTPISKDVNSHVFRFSDTAAHEHLHSNLPPDIMAFTQEPIPHQLSDRTLARYGSTSPFRHREVMREWVQDIFTSGRHGNLIELGTTVELVERLGEEWVLSLRKAEKTVNHWWQERFDAVVVATGHYFVPYMPDIPGIVEYDRKFPGRIMHSKHFHDVLQFQDKRIIVVGGSVSAFDALHDTRLVARKPVISSLRQPSPIFGPAPFTHPDIDNRPQISHFDAETGRITFDDESSVDEVDVVIFATGYNFSFPFLPDVKQVNKRIPGLYQHVFQIDNPSLAFIGMVTGGFGIRIFEWQAVAAARVLAGHATLPTREEMEKWENDRILEKGDSAAFWTLMPDFETHFESLRSLAGNPAPGTAGRVLPRYESAWADSFWDLINTRVRWWSKEATKTSGSPETADTKVLESLAVTS